MERPGAGLALRVGLALVGIASLRLALAAGVGLGDDEAYYWTWAQQLEWSYFDHPGGLAWLVVASTSLLGDTPLAVRLPVVLASTALSAILAWMGRGAGVRGVWTGALLGAFVPALGLMGVFCAPDLPMLVAWMGALAVAEGLGERSGARWAAVGGLVGATLLFKLTGLLLAVGLMGWSLSCPSRRAAWRRPGPWAALGVALAVSAPTWGWNLLHDFPTLRFHAVGRHTHRPGLLDGVGLWLGAHLLLLLPTVAWACVRAPWGPRSALLWWAAAPTWLVFTVATVLTPAKAHWWTPAWVSLLPLAVDWLSHRPVHARRVLGVGLALHLAVLGLARFTPGPLLPVTAELRGWETLASELTELSARAWVTPRYQASAQLEWGARELEAPPVLRVGGRADQYTIWHRDRVDAQGLVLLICPSHLPCTPADVPELDCEPKSRRPAARVRGRVVRSFDVWECQPSR